jgi:hypothetical protein
MKIGRLWLVQAYASSIACAAACGSGLSNGVDGSTNDNGSVGPGDANGEEAGDDDANVEAGDDGCIAVGPDLNKGIFVSPSGQSSSCGSTVTPCNSVQTALNLAVQNNKSIVYLDNGVYTEIVTLAPGITIEGGWTDLGGNWTRQCTPNRATSATIQAPANSNATIVANYAGTAYLDTLTIRSKSQGDVRASESLYGMFVTGSQTMLDLTDVLVTMSNAGAGTNGGAGSAGSTTSGCSGGVASNGGAGANGSPGAGAPQGTFTSSGYQPASGGTGTSGGTGQNGTAGGDGGCVRGGPCDYSGLDGVCEINGDGTPSLYCGGYGTFGCPGTGSGPGQPGTGGGSCVAIYVWDAQVTIGGLGALGAGNGGNGGWGGAGGTPGQGSNGNAGFSMNVAVACGTHPGHICYTLEGGVGTGGAEGGPGGNGGTGGAGGGGAGGFSYCYYKGGNATVNAPNLSCTPGDAGQGGSGGNAGANGANGVHN